MVLCSFYETKLSQNGPFSSRLNRMSHLNGLSVRREVVKTSNSQRLPTWSVREEGPRQSAVIFFPRINLRASAIPTSTELKCCCVRATWCWSKLEEKISRHEKEVPKKHANMSRCTSLANPGYRNVSYQFLKNLKSENYNYIYFSFRWGILAPLLWIKDAGLAEC